MGYDLYPVMPLLLSLFQISTRILPLIRSSGVRSANSHLIASTDFSHHFVLQTDASDYGMGVVLAQRDDSGEDLPISYYSRKLLPREQ